MRGRFTREGIETEGSWRLFRPRVGTLELADTEMVFKGFFGGKTDLARDGKK